MVFVRFYFGVQTGSNSENRTNKVSELCRSTDRRVWLLKDESLLRICYCDTNKLRH
ncbi:unnamed protein product [Tenebrio molitor]|jgi:hypothetical protein|nr:unnamed protein product [Tenebrio molitor]